MEHTAATAGSHHHQQPPLHHSPAQGRRSRRHRRRPKRNGILEEEHPHHLRLGGRRTKATRAPRSDEAQKVSEEVEVEIVEFERLLGQQI